MTRISIDLRGQRFVRLTAIEPTSARHSGQVVWRCICDCGAESLVPAYSLTSGNTRSCGCLRSDIVRQRNREGRKEAVGYANAHWRVKGERGRASEHACVDCAGPAQEWSYDHRDPDELTEAHPRTGEPMAYSLDPSFYSPRCKSCHGIFDNNLRKAGVR